MLYLALSSEDPDLPLACRVPQGNRTLENESNLPLETKEGFPLVLEAGVFSFPRIPARALTYSSPRVTFSLNPFLEWMGVVSGIRAASLLRS